jgi:hypothetical protein
VVSAKQPDEIIPPADKIDGVLIMSDKRAYLTIRPGVGVPLLQALFSGVLLGILAWSMARYFGADDPRVIGLLVGAIAAVLGWFGALVWWRRGLGIEPISPLEKKETMVRLELASDKGRRLQFAELPVELGTLIRFAKGVVGGTSLTEAAWCGNGEIFSSRSEFVNLRDELIRRNLAAWNNPACPARGWALTRSGLAAFEYLVGSPAPK